jgi:hypothetical protein
MSGAFWGRAMEKWNKAFVGYLVGFVLVFTVMVCSAIIWGIIPAIYRKMGG